MKKQFNKKKLLTFGVLGLFSMMLVTGALLTYYGQISGEITIEQALYLEGENVGLEGSYDYVVSLDVGDGVLCNGDACTATLTTLSGNAVIFRADVVSKLHKDFAWDRLITVSGDDWLVANEVFISYAYPANNHGSGNGCWEGNSHFVTAIGSEVPKVTVGGYDGHDESPVGGYELCVEATEFTNIESGVLTWDGGSEDAYGLNRCAADDVNDNIGCMNDNSYDRPSYIIVEFPLNTLGTYDVEFKMVLTA